VISPQAAVLLHMIGLSCNLHCMRFNRPLTPLEPPNYPQPQFSAAHS
jgi:hypothetical protein